jgi:hypothetical protein
MMGMERERVFIEGRDHAHVRNALQQEKKRAMARGRKRDLVQGREHAHR